AGAAGTGGEPGSASGHGTQGVVLLALLGVGEHRVGLADLLELRLSLGVPGVVVRVVGAGELAIGLLDGGRIGVLGNTESRVEVLLQPVLTAHPAPPALVVLVTLTAVRRRPPGPAGSPGRAPCSRAAAPAAPVQW